LVAAEMARDGLRKLVAAEWKLEDIDGVKLENGVFTADGGRSMEWAKACRLMSGDRFTCTNSQNGDFFKPSMQTHSEAVQFADVSVDTETGIVRVNKIVALQNVGLPVNRNTIENQMTGGVIQALSFCLFENRILNLMNGAMVNPNMDMYKIAGSMDVPEIVPIIWREDRNTAVNSLGEPPIVPTLGAIGTAVANAIGAQVRSTPIMPDKVLAALSEKGGVA